jgi:hypothetical protein
MKGTLTVELTEEEASALLAPLTQSLVNMPSVSNVGITRIGDASRVEVTFHPAREMYVSILDSIFLRPSNPGGDDGLWRHVPVDLDRMERLVDGYRREGFASIDAPTVTCGHLGVRLADLHLWLRKLASPSGQAPMVGRFELMGDEIGGT